MAKITKLQRKFIKDIEKNLNVTFTGRNTRNNASDFINLYKDENRKFNIENKIAFPPTGKQLRFIKVIEDTLEVHFSGKTLNDAKKFIQKYIYEIKSHDTSQSRLQRYCVGISQAIGRKQDKRRRRSA